MPYGDVHILYVDFINTAIAEQEKAEQAKKNKNKENSMKTSSEDLQVTPEMLEELQDEIDP